ncbi:MAG: glycosyltransferase family 4 protein [Candidatus Niyogibacteria bacterium]|nr:glycosyltransferase family 4 protein [Candidatus Niyogibacteria bacterium]
MPAKPKKRILIFSLVYYPRFVGGAEVAIKEITDRISPDDFEFDMVALRLDSSLPKFEKIGNVAVHRVGFAMKHQESADSLRFPLFLNKYLFPFTGYWKASQLEKVHYYDAIWCMMASYNGFAALFFKMMNPAIPYLLTLQEGDPISYIKKRVSVLYPLFRKIFTKADLVQTISNYLADFARQMGYGGRIEVVPNGVDVARFSRKYSSEELQDLSERFGKKAGDKFIITTSRLVVKNAVSDIIKALKYLPTNVKFLVLGGGYEMKALKELADKEGLSGRVWFLGYVSHEDMPKYLRISDVFVRPSLSEGFGNSFIEAMAAGLPVVATPVGGIVDFLKDGETGLFCETGNPKSIAEKINTFLNNDDLRKKIVAKAGQMIKEKYEWNKISRDMFEVFAAATGD